MTGRCYIGPFYEDFLIQTMKAEILYRTDVRPSDRNDIRDLAESTGFFSETEIGIAVELIEERLQHGDRSGYDFLFAEASGRVIGYTCFGPIPGAPNRYDIYWIAVHDGFRRTGIGKSLMEKTETAIQKQAGERIYIETSSRDHYKTTRMFYESCGYRKEAVLKDFYRPGDDKLIYVKAISP
jgi:ribosomal protein S18 acetylase RimI-like enzyme